MRFGEVGGWAEPPLEINTHGLFPDAERALVTGEMGRGMEKDGTHVHQASGEAHEQVSLVERHNGIFSELLNGVLNDVQPRDEEQYQKSGNPSMCQRETARIEKGSKAEYMDGIDPKIYQGIMLISEQDVVKGSTMKQSFTNFDDSSSCKLELYSKRCSKSYPKSIW